MKIRILQRIETGHKYYDPEVNDMRHQKIEFDENVVIDMTGTLPDWDRLAKKLIGFGYAEEVIEEVPSE